MSLRTKFVRFLAAATLSLGSANASEVPVASIDSGLGDLPPYSEWKNHPELARFVEAHRLVGEKLDDGLGELPSYSEWKNHPELARFVQEHRLVGEKLDDGLGELPHFSEWRDHPELARLARSAESASGPLALGSR